jgi:hypothetical protein
MQPTRAGALLFRVKVLALQARRAARELVSGRPPVPRRTRGLIDERVAGRSITPLWTAGSPDEFRLTAGKVENLRVAVRRLDGVELGPGEVFSFWRALGRPSRGRGYVEGREIREGCVVPSVAGGLCQLSNALYDAALHAGFEIVERHAHTRVVPGSLAEVGRDATVFWSYVDLRFSSPTGLRIEAELTGGDLVVTLRAPPAPAAPEPSAPGRLAPTVALAPKAASCETCGVHSCFRHVALHKTPGARVGTTAFLVDGVWPEWVTYLESERQPGDALFMPLDGARWRRPAYAWPTTGFERVEQSAALTLWRAWRSRRLAAQGAARQRALLAFDEALATSYARRLRPEMTHLVIAQSLLAPLARAGVLGGRTFDVLMTRVPLATLQARLDAASRSYPSSPTLADFRVDAAAVAFETRTLRKARRIVTPSSDVAAEAHGRAHKLAWHWPDASPPRPGATGDAPPLVLFPGPTAGRKGAYELRAAVAALGFRLRVVGADLEGADFWRGVLVERVPRATAPAELLAGVALVCAPSHVEGAPRLLLQAVRAGVPVIASKACGLAGVDGVSELPEVTAGALIAALGAALDARPVSRLAPQR